MPTTCKEDCEKACNANDHCKFYIFNENETAINCFFGDFDDSNPLDFGAYLKGIVKINKKVSTK